MSLSKPLREGSLPETFLVGEGRACCGEINSGGPAVPYVSEA